MLGGYGVWIQETQHYFMWSGPDEEEESWRLTPPAEGQRPSHKAQIPQAGASLPPGPSLHGLHPPRHSLMAGPREARRHMETPPENI